MSDLALIMKDYDDEACNFNLVELFSVRLLRMQSISSSRAPTIQCIVAATWIT